MAKDALEQQNTTLTAIRQSLEAELKLAQNETVKSSDVETRLLEAECSLTEVQKELERTQKAKDDEHQLLEAANAKLIELTVQYDAVNEQLHALITEREQLVQLVNAKHEESVKYHTEMERLAALVPSVEEQVSYLTQSSYITFTY